MEQHGPAVPDHQDHAVLWQGAGDGHTGEGRQSVRDLTSRGPLLVIH